MWGKGCCFLCKEKTLAANDSWSRKNVAVSLICKWRMKTKEEAGDINQDNVVPHLRILLTIKVWHDFSLI